MNFLARATAPLIKAALVVTGLVAVSAAAVIFADPLGLGVQQDFILYRWYGIARRPATGVAGNDPSGDFNHNDPPGT